MTDWLQQRLTRIKKLSQRWLVLAQALEKIWEEFFDPYFTRLENMRSGYLMNEEDLTKKMRELGDVVVYELNKNNRPIALAWRHLELTYKEQIDIFEITANRVMGHTDMEICPYFAPVDKEYGTEFKTYKDFKPIDASKKHIPPDGYFLTSRVLCLLSWDDFAARGYTAEQFVKNIFPLINSVKPLHITFKTVTTTSDTGHSVDERIAFASSVRTLATVALGQNTAEEYPSNEYLEFAAAGGRSDTTVFMGQTSADQEFRLNEYVGTTAVTFTKTVITEIKEIEE